MGYPVLIVGAVLDFLINFVICSVIFLEVPREFLVTQRLTRHIKKSNNYKQKIAKWICSNLLDSFDVTGNHCK